jgi:arginyl-tRNA synthetase
MNIIELKQALTEAFPYEWNLAPQIGHGVLSTNAAFKLAKEQGKNPTEIAFELTTTINTFFAEKSLPFIGKATGPYLNISFTEEGLQSFFYQKESFELTPTNTNPLLLDYFAPNVGKTMHIGNIRSSNIGETLRRIFETHYTTVISNNHLGDWGIQFGLLLWGIERVKTLKLDFQTIDWENELPLEIVAKLQKIYVEVNKLCETDETIKQETKIFAEKLEGEMVSGKAHKSIELWKNIVNASVYSYTNSEGYLGVNCTHRDEKTPFLTEELKSKLEQYNGVWSVNSHHKQGQFDVILGESFYTYFMGEAEYWVEKGLAVKEGLAIYFDLEDIGLGRCYIVTSEGYSIYAGRDILARFLWSGLFDSHLSISCADSRQMHSFNQVFAVVQKIATSGIYDDRPFPLLTQEKTLETMRRLAQKEALKHVSFGFMTLPEGAMSTRKGKVLLFETLKNQLEKEVEKVLLEKNPKIKLRSPFYQKVQKISVAALKWQDLYRDREQDIVFDVKDVIKFEGNTGVYQLYTLSRISNILRKTETSNKLHPESLILLNQTELDILAYMYTLPYTIEGVVTTMKPHVLCSHLFEFNTMVNSWYVEYSVSREEDLSRRDALLHLCVRITKHIKYCLELLGIEAVDEL